MVNNLRELDAAANRDAAVLLSRLQSFRTQDIFVAIIIVGMYLAFAAHMPPALSSTREPAICRPSMATVCTSGIRPSCARRSKSSTTKREESGNVGPECGAARFDRNPCGPIDLLRAIFEIQRQSNDGNSHEKYSHREEPHEANSLTKVSLQVNPQDDDDDSASSASPFGPRQLKDVKMNSKQNTILPVNNDQQRKHRMDDNEPQDLPKRRKMFFHTSTSPSVIEEQYDTLKIKIKVVEAANKNASDALTTFFYQARSQCLECRDILQSFFDCARRCTEGASSEEILQGPETSFKVIHNMHRKESSLKARNIFLEDTLDRLAGVIIEAKK